MTAQEFVARYGALFEHSPWVVERAFAVRGDDLMGRFMAVIAAASEAEQLGLIRAHPELAARVALTEASAAEQRGAGLRALTAAEFERFAVLNAAYRERFGFPFVICVGAHTKEGILAQFERRLGRGVAQERVAALGEIGKIARLRLGALA